MTGNPRSQHDHSRHAFAVSGIVALAARVRFAKAEAIATLLRQPRNLLLQSSLREMRASCQLLSTVDEKLGVASGQDDLLVLTAGLRRFFRVSFTKCAIDSESFSSTIAHSSKCFSPSLVSL